MAHFQQLRFVEAIRSLFPECFEGAKVLEIGSWSQHGTVRDQFKSCDYIGADVTSGEGVDLPVPGQNLAFATDTFDVVLTCECFEHNPFWLETFVNMVRMLKPGGILMLTCAGTGRGEHGTKRTGSVGSLSALADHHEDYYRNLTRRDFERRIDLGIHFSCYQFFNNRYSKDLYFVGFKRAPVPDPVLAEKLITLAVAAKGIKLKKTPTVIRTLSAHGEWWMKWSLTRALGERRYHDLRFRLRRRLARPVPPGASSPK